MFKPLVSRRGPSLTQFAELFLAAGPQVLHDPADNSVTALFGRSWLVLVDRQDRLVKLYAEGPGGDWQRVLVPAHPVIDHPAVRGSRRYSLAFDQAATPVVAFEGAGQVVKVTRWDSLAGEYIQNVSFGGVDPVLLMDAVWTGNIEVSDVLLFYLASDRERVEVRVQRDRYGVPYSVHDYGRPVILDRAAALSRSYQLLLSEADGVPFDEGLQSGLYPFPPYRHGLPLHGAAELLAAELRLVVTEYRHGFAIAGGGALVGGDYVEVATRYGHVLGLMGAAAVQGGTHRQVVTRYWHGVSVAGSARMGAAELSDVGHQVFHSVGLFGAGAIIGGVYAKA